MICGNNADGDKLAEEAHALLTRVAVVTTGFTWARTQALSTTRQALACVLCCPSSLQRAVPKNDDEAHSMYAVKEAVHSPLVRKNSRYLGCKEASVRSF